MSSTPHVSRLFHAVVLMGCALGGATGCGSTPDSGDARAEAGSGCQVPDGGWPDGGAPHDPGACDGDAGWPPTK